MGAADARPDLVDQNELRLARAAPSLDQRLARLPDSHPASRDYAAGSRSPGDSRRFPVEVHPFTDAEHTSHVAVVRARLAEGRAAALGTEFWHTIDVKREIWSDAREEIHDALLADLYSGESAVPCDGKAVIAGGLPGAGKTTVLMDRAGIDRAGYLTINPDELKAEMARRGLIPGVDGLTPMEASAFVHEECSHIAKRLAHRAQADRRNIVWDVTMSSTSSIMERIDSLMKAGYNQIDSIFVDIPTETSVQRADGRHRQGHDEYRAGIGLGGRYILPEMIAAQSDPVWGSRNRSNFEQLKGMFQSWFVYDNSMDGQAAVLTGAHDGNKVFRGGRKGEYDRD
jgi:predicted ABC-type ATPase